MTRPDLDGVLCALATPGQVAALGHAIEEGPLTAEEERYLTDLADLHAGRAVLADGPAQGQALGRS